MPNIMQAYEREKARTRQAVVDAVTYSAKVTRAQLLRAANKTGFTELYNELTWKKLWMICFCLSCALTLEYQTNLPLVSGAPQLMGAILSNTAYLLSLLATTTDPMGNPLVTDFATLSASVLLYANRPQRLQEAPEISLAELAARATEAEKRPTSPTSM